MIRYFGRGNDVLHSVAFTVAHLCEGLIFLNLSLVKLELSPRYELIIDILLSSICSCLTGQSSLSFGSKLGISVKEVSIVTSR